MKKRIILGSFFAAFIILAIPLVSAVESKSAEERFELQKVLKEQLKDNIETKPYEPGCILRLLLILRNLVIGGIVLIILKILGIFGNRTAWTVKK